MELQELYETIGGDYEQATRVLRVEKLIDKHIRRLPNNQVFEQMDEAGKSMDATQLFESAHAMKGLCANLGLMKLSDMASDLAEEFRPGNTRTMSDEEVRERVAQIDALHERTIEGIRQYEAG
jgi:HPt (histidine-containing phosphotransfer) domain-containing protein